MVSRKVLAAIVAVIVLAAAGFAYYYTTHPSPQRILESSHKANARIKSLAAEVYIFNGTGKNATLIAVERYAFFAPDTIVVSQDNYYTVRIGDKVYYVINNRSYVLTSKPLLPILPITDPLNFEKIGSLKSVKTVDGEYVIDVVNKTTGVEYKVYINRSSNLLNRVDVITPYGSRIVYVVRIIAVNLKKPDFHWITSNATPVNASELYKLLYNVTLGYNTSYNVSAGYNISNAGTS